MPYTLKFSDPTKISEISVPDMPPGINTVDTSINLVGRGYPNYSQKTAENFLHLLENFAGPNSPQNPIEGQLWYDTSDPTNKVLRIMDGTATSARWPSATGIYQQPTDPRNSPSIRLKSGDIWVDTLLNQLKIYTSTSWNVVGPAVGSGGSKTGVESSIIEDTLGLSHPVIMHYVSGKIIAIAADSTFIPNPVITGFLSLKAGITLSLDQAAIFNGTSNAALGLEISGNKYNSNTFLRKDDTSYAGQIITGKVVFQTSSNANSAQGRDGIIVNNSTSNSEYLQLYKSGNDAVLLNNTIGGKIIFKTRLSSSTALDNTVTIQRGIVGINTATTINSPNLDVFGTTRISGGLNITSTANNAVTVAGSITVGKNVTITENLTINGGTTSTGILTVGTVSGSGISILPDQNNTYDIGSVSSTFRSIYASEIHTSKVNGSAISFPGMITVFGGNTAPPGWVLCDGSSFTTTNYAALFSVIGYKYGGADTTANLPNMSTSTYVSTGTGTGTYLTYIIKL